MSMVFYWTVGGYRNHVVDGKIREIASFAVSTMNFDTGVSNNVVEVTHAMTQVGIYDQLVSVFLFSRLHGISNYDAKWTIFNWDLWNAFQQQIHLTSLFCVRNP